MDILEHESFRSVSFLPSGLREFKRAFQIKEVRGILKGYRLDYVNLHPPVTPAIRDTISRLPPDLAEILGHEVAKIAYRMPHTPAETDLALEDRPDYIP